MQDLKPSPPPPLSRCYSWAKSVTLFFADGRSEESRAGTKPVQRLPEKGGGGGGRQRNCIWGGGGLPNATHLSPTPICFLFLNKLSYFLSKGSRVYMSNEQH